jgi:hypothetical protein
MAHNYITIPVKIDPIIEPLIDRAEQDPILAMILMDAMHTDTALVPVARDRSLTLHLSDRLMAAYYESLGL